MKESTRERHNKVLNPLAELDERGGIVWHKELTKVLTESEIRLTRRREAATRRRRSRAKNN